MRLLLDTHAFLWFILDDPKLSTRADALISDSANEIEISPASYWEIAINRDPFDRLIVAQSIVEEIAIVSNDSALDAYGVKRFW